MGVILPHQVGVWSRMDDMTDLESGAAQPEVAVRVQAGILVLR